MLGIWCFEHPYQLGFSIVYLTTEEIVLSFHDNIIVKQ